MALGPGNRLGAYEIVSLLGAGGMGEVYRARDTKLGRDVAIKVLPQALRDDPDRLARFEREAKTLAALNHPHIGAIYGLEEANGTQFLVLELVDGESLDKRIARGKIPVDEALTVAKQIAEALEAAHEKGIIHRDLKPANIAITNDGNVKVLDFGLAKPTETAAASSLDVTTSPTITSPAMMTGIGVILGTAAYMSPEQAKGRPADKRSDAWAFGCVVYEMLTGKRAFEGEDVSETLAAVLRGEPDWSQLPESVPGLVRTMLRKSLAKDRALRAPDLAVVRFLLDTSVEPLTAPFARAAARFWQGLSAALVVLLLAGLCAWGWWWWRADVTPTATARFTIPPPANWTFVATGRPAVAGLISPDGRTLTFTARSVTGQVQLFTRRIDSLAAEPIQGTDSASFPFWSPDSRYIGYFVRGKVMKVAVAGGGPEVICETSGPAVVGRGGTWSANGTILFNNGPGLLAWVRSTGGQPVGIPDRSPGQADRVFPEFLPDGEHAVYYATGGPPLRGLSVLSIASGETKHLADADTSAVYDSRTRSLVFVRRGVLLAQPFRAETLELTGDAVTLADKVASGAIAGMVTFSRSESGVLTFGLGGNASAGWQLIWVDRNGKKIRSVGPPANYEGIALAPDEHRVAVHRHDLEGGDVWIIDLDRDTSSRLTFDSQRDNQSPVWSPDGKALAFSAITDSSKFEFKVFRKAASGVGDVQPVFGFVGGLRPTAWSPNGRMLMVQTLDVSTRQDLWLVPATDDKAEPTPWLRTPFNENHAQFSTDGKWVAYASTETGISEVYLQSFPDASGKWQVSAGGANFPFWRKDGRELFYVDGKGALNAVDVQVSDKTVLIGHARELFDADLPSTTGGSGTHPSVPYAVSGDGQRFLLTRMVNAETARAEIGVIMNWPALLTR